MLRRSGTGNLPRYPYREGAKCREPGGGWLQPAGEPHQERSGAPTSAHSAPGQQRRAQPGHPAKGMVKAQRGSWGKSHLERGSGEAGRDGSCSGGGSRPVQLEAHRKPAALSRTRGRQGVANPRQSAPGGGARAGSWSLPLRCAPLRGWASQPSPALSAGVWVEPLLSWKVQRDLKKPDCPLGRRWRTLDKVVKNSTLLHSDCVAGRQIFTVFLIEAEVVTLTFKSEALSGDEVSLESTHIIY